MFTFFSANNHQTRDSSSDSSEISITTMESSDDETSNNNDTPSTHDSNSSIGSVDLFGDEEESLDYNVDAENSEPTAFVSQESLDSNYAQHTVQFSKFF